MIILSLIFFTFHVAPNPLIINKNFYFIDKSEIILVSAFCKCDISEQTGLLLALLVNDVEYTGYSLLLLIEVYW
jgi:hypothetical protein